nr:hypothetical protein [Tanacetum cinerariifolium]
MGGDGIVGGDDVLNESSSEVIDERVIVMSMGSCLELIEDKDVPLVDGVLEGALVNFGFLESLEVEACMEAMELFEVEDERRR